MKTYQDNATVTLSLDEWVTLSMALTEARISYLRKGWDSSAETLLGVYVKTFDQLEQDLNECEHMEQLEAQSRTA
jgi:hypothetical protein